MGIESQVSHMPVAEAKSAARNYDIVITSPAFVATFDSVKDHVKIAAVKNPLSQAEYTEVLKANGLA